MLTARPTSKLVEKSGMHNNYVMYLYALPTVLFSHMLSLEFPSLRLFFADRLTCKMCHGYIAKGGGGGGGGHIILYFIFCHNPLISQF